MHTFNDLKRLVPILNRLARDAAPQPNLSSPDLSRSDALLDVGVRGYLYWWAGTQPVTDPSPALDAWRRHHVAMAAAFWWAGRFIETQGELRDPDDIVREHARAAAAGDHTGTDLHRWARSTGIDIDGLIARAEAEVRP